MPRHYISDYMYQSQARDLKCPDCGAEMRLTASQYGLFYGCVEYHLTGCRGSVTADGRTGQPYGAPVPAPHRKLRAEIILLRKRIHQEGTPFENTSFRDMDMKACQEHIKFLRGLLGERSVWTRLLEDD
jgi:ssDNA-binding Zn-finger/Zn-ribbon topoisomerase 1